MATLLSLTSFAAPQGPGPAPAPKDCKGCGITNKSITNPIAFWRVYEDNNGSFGQEFCRVQTRIVLGLFSNTCGKLILNGPDDIDCNEATCELAYKVQLRTHESIVGGCDNIDVVFKAGLEPFAFEFCRADAEDYIQTGGSYWGVWETTPECPGSSAPNFCGNTVEYGYTVDLDLAAYPVGTLLDNHYDDNTMGFTFRCHLCVVNTGE